MNACSNDSDYRWLTGNEAAAVLCELSAEDEPLHSALARLRRQHSANRAHLVVELVELRRRAGVKFSAAERMFFTRTALEQASDEHVARHKAARFVELAQGAIADLCCGIGGDSLALAGQGSVVAIDCNPVALHYASANARTVASTADVRFQMADAAEFDIGQVAAWHIDPDRRATGHRTTSLEYCTPGLGTIERLLQGLPHAAVKLAPATKVPPGWTQRCELEWISRGGECRQLVAWHGALAHSPGRHRATVLRATSAATSRTIEGVPNEALPISPEVRAYVFDVDPAVLAARLTGTLASMHDLMGLSLGPTYLTGDMPVSDAALACFQVENVLPLRVRSLAKHLRERGIGRLEIKKRGVDLLPEKLRHELKLRGERAATLLLTQLAGRQVAILAQRIS